MVVVPGVPLSVYDRVRKVFCLCAVKGHTYAAPVRRRGMARSPRQQLAKQREMVAEQLDGPTAEAVLELGEALDRAGKAPRTAEVYLRCLRLLATEDRIDLLGCSAEDINRALAERYDNGEGLSTNTLIGYVSAAVAFYTHHDALGIEPDDINRYQPNKTPRHDQADMFTEDEVFALREACALTRNPTRNRAFLELLLFTGQRIRAVLTLRADDIDVSGGAFYLNAAADGLKGATRRGRRRPLFGSRKYVREWVTAHPTGGWLFVGDPTHPDTAMGEHWSYESASQQLRRLADLAGVDKPVNAHNFRHYTVTVLRRDYGQDWEDIGALLGLVKGSTVAKTTYAHVDDDRSRRTLEESMGYAEPEPENRFAPPVCPTCAEVLKPEWRMCPACGETFGPKDGSSPAEWMSEESIASDDPTRRFIGEAIRRELERTGHS